MNKNEIYIKSGTNYKEMTKELLAQCGLASVISDKKMQIGIKPNLVSPSEASWGATTHPEIVAGIIEYLQENGYGNIAILEGSWVGDKTTEAYEVCGYRELTEKYQVPFWDMQKDKGIERDCRGMKLNVCERAANIDFLINVPVLKGHCQTKITCALKNMKGCDELLGLQDTLKALADPIRREILNLLKGGRLSAGEICEHFSVTGASISRHLAILKDADLIRSKREGKFIYYELNTSVLEDVMLWITDLKGVSDYEGND